MTAILWDGNVERHLKEDFGNGASLCMGAGKIDIGFLHGYTYGYATYGSDNGILSH
jgi:hypothetical protein